MPEMTATYIGLLALALVIGVVLGWVFRGERSAKEKIAVNAGWQDQLESQQSEHGRLAEQNKSLMEQISQYQASHKDSINRAKELSDSLKEAFERRDELQRQLKDYRSTLEVTKAQRDKLKSAIENREIQNKSSASGLKEKDDKIFRLSRELTSWQSRVPPLVEKFQERDKQARELEAELEAARSRIASFEEMARSNQTRIEPVDAETLPDGLDASNEPHSDTSAHAVSQLQDQVSNAHDEDAATEDEPESVEEYTTSEEILLPEDEFIDEGDEADEDEFIDEGDEADEDNDADEDDEADEEFAAVNDEILTGGHRSFDGNSGANGENDNLQQIKGVGPAIEKTLNDLGIFRFNQIAEMSEYDIDRVARRLKGFRSRIYREDWIGQARDLHYQKNNNPS